jgi:hypothetical protein
MTSGLNLGPASLPPDSKSKASPASNDHSDSSSESEDNDEDEEVEQPPLPATRPTDPVNAAEYDVIKAVWHPRSSYVENDILVSRITQFSELLIKYRDAWRKANEALKQASEKGTAAASLTSNALIQRQILERAIISAVQYGHPEILSM